MALGFPVVQVYLGLGSNPLSVAPTWTLVADNSDSATRGRFVSLSMTSSGRSLDLEDFEGGSGVLTLRNNDGRFTPGNTASPYYPNIKLRMPVRIVATRSTDVLTIRGYVNATPVRHLPPSSSICEWPIVDAFTLLEAKAAEYPWAMAIRTSAPKLWLNFNELSGTTALDDSGNGYHGTYTGSPTLQVSFGTGIGATFNGTSQEAVFPSGASITGTGDFAIEFYADVSVTGTDQVVYGQYDYTAAQGILLYVLASGVVHLTTKDGTGTTTVTGVINVASSPETHVIVRRQGTTHEILVNGVVDATVTGTARNIPAAVIGAPGVSAAVTIDALATYQGTMTQATAIAHFQALLAYHALYAGQQIGYILDAFGWPTADRSLDTGNSQVLGQFVPTGSVLDMIRLAANSDMGAVYVTLAGIVRFRQRQAIMVSPYTTSQGTFGNTGASLPIVIEALRLDYDASRIKNDVTLKVNWQTGAIVTTPYEVAVRKTDAASSTTYGAQTWSRDVYTMAPGGTSATALVLNDLADYILSRYNAPLREIRELTLHPVEESATALWTHVLTRTQEDRITHTHTMPGGEVVTGDYHIQKIRHDIGPGKTWRTVWTVSPADTQSYWIWDTSTWDTSTRWGA